MGCIFGLSVAALPLRAEQVESPPPSFAWAQLLNQGGTWVCSEPPETAIPALIDSGVEYIRASGAAGPALDAGIPTGDNAAYFRQLQEAGLKLGVVLFTQNDISDELLVQKAQVLRQSGFFDWLMVDGIRYRASTQQLINDFRDAGWDRIMLNVSGWEKGQPIPIPDNCWCYAKMFSAWEKDDPPYVSGPALVARDLEWVDEIHAAFPGSLAALKLEIPWQIDHFKALSLERQKELLSGWSDGQSELSSHINTHQL